MLTPRPPQIGPAHLQKKALVYIRQSSLAQLRDHVGSTAAQFELVDLARAWGWPESRIELIDADLGMSGTSATKRTGFQSLLAMIERNEVGIVFVRDHKRLARTLLDGARFLDAAQRAGILIYANGRVYDTASESDADSFSLMLESVLAVRDNTERVRMFASARTAKARLGHAVSTPPIGYVRALRGKWAKDPDLAVRDAIQRAFDLYLRLRSLTKTAKCLSSEGLGFPRKVRGEVRFGQVTPAQLHFILRHPAYTGDYIYRRFRTSRATDSAPRRLERRPREEWIRVESHHEHLVERDVWERVQELLESQRPRMRPLVGKGDALLQGLLRCGVCDGKIHTRYWGRVGLARTAVYVCRRTDGAGRTSHRFALPGRLLDPRITAEVLAALTPVEVETALDVLHEEQKHQTAAERMRRHQLQRAEDVVEEAHDAYRTAAHADPIVKVDLEARYAAALKHRDRLKTEMGTRVVPNVILTPEGCVELIRLINNVQALWSAPTTAPADRKRLLHTVLSEIVVRNVTGDAAELELVWASGFREPLRVLLPRGVETRVRDLTLEGKSPARIADELNAGRAVTASGRPITPNLVAQKQGRLGLRLKHEHTLAKQIISQAILNNTPRPEILARLQAEAPRLGPWTAQRLSDHIRRLRHRDTSEGRVLPAVLPAEEAKLRILALTKQALDEGKAWKVIAALLNDMGLRPPRGAAFTPVQVRALYMRAHRLTSFKISSRPDSKEAGG
jgi:DNA invertase Pin-like site-specific DNA recombinase